MNRSAIGNHRYCAFTQNIQVSARNISAQSIVPRLIRICNPMSSYDDIWCATNCELLFLLHDLEWVKKRKTRVQHLLYQLLIIKSVPLPPLSRIPHPCTTVHSLSVDAVLHHALDIVWQFTLIHIAQCHHKKMDTDYALAAIIREWYYPTNMLWNTLT